MDIAKNLYMEMTSIVLSRFVCSVCLMNQKKKSRISHSSTCILSEYMNINFDYHFLSVFEYLILSKARRVASSAADDEDVKFIRSNIIKSERWNVWYGNKRNWNKSIKSFGKWNQLIFLSIQNMKLKCIESFYYDQNI